MTENQKHQNLVKHVDNLCLILNKNGKRAKYWDSEANDYEYDDWTVDELSPGSTFLGGICGNKDVFMFLKKRGDIDKNICWDCGEQPIGNQYSFSDGSDSSITYFICKDCHSKGAKLTATLRGNSSSSCFIATVCYNDENAIEVKALRRYRDTVLINNFVGTQFTKIYYSISPSISKWLSKKPFLIKLIRVLILDKIVKKLNQSSKRIK
jgi:hypothetical protein